MARYGLRAQDVLDLVEGGIGGDNVSTAISGRERIPIQVRLQRSERDDIERLGDILVPTPSGDRVPLGQVATIRREIGPSEINSENGRLRVFVQANVEGRDLGGFVKETQARLAKEISLPPGMTIEWSGQYENQIRAQHTLRLIVPAALFVIFLLLYIVYHSAKEAAHVILAVPFALTGGVFLQWLLGYNFSVAVWVGYIALFGTAIQTGVVMVVYLDEAVKKKMAERGETFFARGFDPGGERRRAIAAAPESDDGGHHRCQPAADFVEPPHRRRSDETAGDAGHRRHVEQPRVHPDCDAGDFRLAAGAGNENNRR